jgi:hypothetical protein
MSLAAARRECQFANSYSRLEVALQWCPMTQLDGPKLRADAWWRLLGEQWSMCDNIAAWSDVLRALLAQAPRHQVEQMMDQAERETLAAMPAEFTVWRGCYAFNLDGLSWSTNRAIAAGFPFLNRYRRGDASPLLVEAVCRRGEAILKLDRGESEVIAHRVKLLRITELGLEQHA